MILDEGATHYRPISWDDALREVADALRGLDDPNEAIFYTSGRTSNEAAFLYQLLVRGLGTNNLPDCSNMCHESSGSALTETLGIGKGTVSIEDIHEADLLIVAGQNPGTNHPRMLSALEKAKDNGATIVAVNPLPEAALIRYKNPQTPRGVILGGKKLADEFVQIRLGGDQALFQAIGKHLLETEDARWWRARPRIHRRAHRPASRSMRPRSAAVPWRELVAATGVPEKALRRVAERVRTSKATIVCWAMGLTQHKHAVATLRDVVNVLLLQGNIGRPGAGVCPVRGHSNVQGDRTMGIYEKPSEHFLAALDREFALHRAARARARHRRGDPRDARRHGPRLHGDGRQLRLGHPRHERRRGGAAQRRAHRAGVDEAEPLPRRDRQARDHPADARPHRSRPARRSRAAGHGRGLHECRARLARTARAARGGHAERGGDRRADLRAAVRVGCRQPVRAADRRRDRGRRRLRSARARWDPVRRSGRGAHASESTRSRRRRGVRDRFRARTGRLSKGTTPSSVGTSRRSSRASTTSRSRIEKGRTLFLPNGPRDGRSFATATGKAVFTANPLEYPFIPHGRLLLQTLRSHDQYNTTIYGKDDRYRGIHGGRRVILVNPKDIQKLGFVEGDIVDLVSEWRRRCRAPGGGVPHRRVLHAARERRRVLPRDERARAARLRRRRQRDADLEVRHRPPRAPDPIRADQSSDRHPAAREVISATLVRT